MDQDDGGGEVLFFGRLFCFSRFSLSEGLHGVMEDEEERKSKVKRCVWRMFAG